MNTQNVNVKTATPESPKTWAENQSSTALTGNISSDDFFAPSTAGLLDNLLAQYKFMRARLYSISNVISDIESQKGISYFLRGNYNSSRGYHVPPVCKLFDISGALAALNAEYWQSALDLTDVYEYMPNDRRTEWNKQITEMDTPDFEDDTVRANLSELLFSKEKFFSERVGGIFRSLSGEHITNRPEGFSKRMIINRVYDEYGYVSYERSGYIDDLRKVIAKFMGRDPEGSRNTDKLLKVARERSGTWLTVDGGALRLKAFLKGTLHLEIHQDMAWRLNDILAFLYPAAIPAQHRQKPRDKNKVSDLLTELLPFSVLAELSDLVTERHEPYRSSRWNEEREPVTTNPLNRRFKNIMDFDISVRNKSEEVLISLGGVKMKKNAFTWFEFDYDPETTIQDILLCGAVPDVKTHQFYPTRIELATKLLDDVAICDGEKCLEPSAGTGGLADMMPKEQTTCIEVSPLRCRILEAKGHQVINDDFLSWAAQTSERFDVVVMNPPFSEGRAVSHVRSAAELVKAGGRLGAILPAGSERKDLLPGWVCNWSDVQKGMFAGANVSVIRLIAYKPE